MTEFITKGEMEQTEQRILQMFNQHKLLVTQRKWRARLLNKQLNIPQNVWTTVQLDTIQYDCEGVGITSYGYTIRERGLHLFSASVRWSSCAASQYYYAQFLNFTTGAYPDYQLHYKAGGGYHGQKLCAWWECEIGELILLQVRHTGVPGPDIDGGNVSWMAVHLQSRVCF